MDRFTWGVVGGVIAICVVALGSAVVLRAGEKPPDLSTPEGVALAYAIAVQNQDPDRAWGLLASPEAAGFPGPFGGPPPVPPLPTETPEAVPPPRPPTGAPQAVPPAAPPSLPTSGAPRAAAGTPPPVATPTPARASITQEQFRQTVYNNPRRAPGRRLRVTGVAMLAPDRARVDMEVTMTTDGFRFPFFGFGGPGSGYTVTFELQRQASAWRITSAPPVFNFL